MRQERAVQATIFEVLAQHEIGCELKMMSKRLDGQPALISLVVGRGRPWWPTTWSCSRASN
jgi:IS5 family transposase